MSYAGCIDVTLYCNVVSNAKYAIHDDKDWSYMLKLNMNDLKRILQASKILL